MAAPCPRCGFGEQFCRAVITGKGDLSIAKGDRTTIKRCLENFDKAPDGKDLALGAALSASTEKSAHKGCFSYYNKALQKCNELTGSAWSEARGIRTHQSR